MCAFGGVDVWDDGGGDRHWCNLAYRSQVWHLSHCLLPQYGAVLLEQQRNGIETEIKDLQ